MKLKNRIMSWVLAPGTYMVWHALGDPTEWEYATHTLTHKPTRFQLWHASGRWFLSEWHGERQDCFGLLERHIIWPRVRRCVQQLHPTGWRHRNRRLFVLMTQLTDKEVH